MTDSLVHPSAYIDPQARIGNGVRIQPFAVIEGEVEIGDGSEIGAHAVIHRWTRMGRNNRVGPHAVIGGAPQHTGYDGSETWLEIGDNNVFREGITINRAMDPEQPTRLGSDCYMMAYAHVGHDCQVGNGVILTNNICLGGHVEVGERTVIGGGSLVHQFCRIGSFTMVAGDIAVRKDVMPYTMIAGEPPRHYRLNSIGLRRNGISGANYKAIESAFRHLRDGGDITDDVLPDTPEITHLREWFANVTKRGVYGFSRADAREKRD